MYKDTEHYCLTCLPCQTRKSPRNKSALPLECIPVGGPFERMGVDVLGPFVKSNAGNRYILVFTDALTKWPEAFATPHTQAELIAKIMVENIFATHGAPRTLLSDRGSNFLSQIVEATSLLLGTKRLRTSGYHPQCNGQTERFNSVIAQCLSMVVQKDQKNWDDKLPYVLMAYRFTPHATTLESPFFLLYGRDPKLPVDIDLLPPEKPTSVKQHIIQLQENLKFSRDLADGNIKKSQQVAEEKKAPKPEPETYEIGDKVWVFVPSTVKGLTTKLLHRWHGPFRVTGRPGTKTYTLDIQGRRLPLTINKERMKRFFDPQNRPTNIIETDLDNADIPMEYLPEDSFRKAPPVEI